MATTADTSVVVAALCDWHEHHPIALRALDGVESLPAHVVLEATSVISRLPAGLLLSLDRRAAPAYAAVGVRVEVPG